MNGRACKKLKRTERSILGLEEGGNALALEGFAALGSLEVWLAHGRSNREPLQVVPIVWRAQRCVLPEQPTNYASYNSHTRTICLVCSNRLR